ncbi:MAG: NHLP family bacteriocin export ABC transporter peptidase/permease/ATPase subunit [Myxococcota bacterium]|jgi:ATP-binding cassette subfamily C protein|nr:NHLP family bacteriocin export ABC transporter peptidase/permease/ATPase subunit [Myxococcota bacterium]
MSSARIRVKTPQVLQLEATECGAAALAILLAHHGRIVPLSELRIQCGVSRDGSKAANVLKAARSYGMVAKGLKKSLEGAIELACPYIAFWGFNHFLVVEGFDHRRQLAYLNDPAFGHRTVTFQEFGDGFTGVALVLTPGPDFRQGGRPPRLLPALLSRLQHARAALVYLLVASLLLSLPGLLLPAYTQLFLDRVLGHADIGWLKPLLLALTLTALFQAVVTALKLAYLRRLGIHLAVTMSSRFFWHLLRLPTTFFSQRYGGEVALRQQLNDSLAALLSGRLADTLVSLLMMVFYAAVMFCFDVELTLIGILFAAASFLALRQLGRQRAEASQRARNDFGRAAGASVAALQAMETLKAAGLENDFFGKWASQYTKAVNTSIALSRSSQTLAVLPVLLNGLGTMLIYLIGGFAVVRGEMSVGMLIAFTALMAGFQAPVGGLVGMGALLQELSGDLQRLDDVLAHPLEPERAGEELPAEEPPAGNLDDNSLIDKGFLAEQQLVGHLSVRDLTFGYSPLEPPLLSKITLEVPSGHRLALVGGSGSGKSTLASLICGLQRPWSGEVLLDGRPREAIPRQVLSHSFAVVTQDVFLFEGTVRDNLTLWDPTVDDLALHRALEDAALLDVILALPGGLDGRLPEGGASLSGGQRQRLEIARALVHDPRILVLDEATSALDPETERLIDERLRLRGCTCVLVAHRLSTIRDCDEIVVLQRGVIQERGTHQQLWARGGLYRELLRHGEGTGEPAATPAAADGGGGSPT